MWTSEIKAQRVCNELIRMLSISVSKGVELLNCNVTMCNVQVLSLNNEQNTSMQKQLIDRQKHTHIDTHNKPQNSLTETHTYTQKQSQSLLNTYFLGFHGDREVRLCEQSKVVNPSRSSQVERAHLVTMIFTFHE